MPNCAWLYRRYRRALIATLEAIIAHCQPQSPSLIIVGAVVSLYRPEAHSVLNSAQEAHSLR